MKEEKVELISGNIKIFGVLSLASRERRPCVIVSHGLFSNKDSLKFKEISEEFSREGLSVLRFDFMGCGESEGRIEDTTISIRLSNLDTIFEFVSNYPLIDKERLGLLGSSLGGYLSLLKAAGDERVKALVVWATPYSLVELRDKLSTSNEPPLKEDFYYELNRYSLESCLDKVSRCLVIHGSTDELVPLSHASKIYEKLKRPKSFKVISGADHRFLDDSLRAEARGYSLEWFKKYLWTL